MIIRELWFMQKLVFGSLRVLGGAHATSKADKEVWRQTLNHMILLQKTSPKEMNRFAFRKKSCIFAVELARLNGATKERSGTQEVS
jgi:hypothetical protein